MARKKSPAALAAAAAALAEQAAAAEQVEVLADEDSESDDALAELAQVGDGEEVRFVINCIAPLANKGQIDEVGREEIPGLATLLRDRYGPGKYTVRAVGRRGFIRGGHRTITISPLAVKRDAPGATAPAVPAGVPTSFAEFLQQQQLVDERRRQEAREDHKARMEMVLGLATALGPSLIALLGRSGAPAESMTSMLQGLAGLKDLIGGSGSEKMVETLVKGIELGKEAGGGSESWPGIIRDTVRDLAGAPPVQKLIAGIAGRPASPPAGPPAAAPKVPYQPPVATAPPQGAIPLAHRPAPQGVSPQIWQQWVLPLLNKLADELLEFAQNDADPGLAADALEAKIPRAARAFITAAQLREWLTNPNWWEQLKGFRPALEPYHGYCDNVRLELVGLFTPAESPPAAPESPPPSGSVQ